MTSGLRVKTRAPIFCSAPLGSLRAHLLKSTSVTRAQSRGALVIDCKGGYFYEKATIPSISYFSSVVTCGTIPSVLHATVPDQPN